MKTERTVTLDVLADIFYGKAYNNLALNKALEALPPEKRGAVTEMVNGVLRHYIYLDYVIGRHSSVKPNKIKSVILCLLRLSAYQLIFMNKPDYAVCSEAVAIAAKRGFVGLKGFVNGVLRSVARAVGDGAHDVPQMDDITKYFSIKYSCPEWIVSRFVKQFGREKTEQILAVNYTPPDVTVRANTVKTTVAELRVMLEQEGVTVAEGRFDKDCLHISKAAVNSLDSFKSGLFYVQDESAALPALMASPKHGDVVFDICAAPGGKAFTMACLAQNKAQIFAFDIHAHKVKLIKDGAARLGLDIRAEISDALVFKQEFEGAADIVLLDAPCSGLGLLRKKPDIKLTKTEGHVAQLAQLQRQMAAVSVRCLKRGGTFVYGTCTLTHEENEDNAKWMEAHLPLKLIEAKTILPCDFGTDGFFAARFIKLQAGDCGSSFANPAVELWLDERARNDDKAGLKGVSDG